MFSTFANTPRISRSASAIALAGIAALTAGCGGGGGGTVAAPVTPITSGAAVPTQSSTRGTLALTILGVTKASSTARLANQITNDVTGVQVVVNGGATTQYTAGTAPCGASSGGSFTCTLPVPVGSDTISVATTAGAQTPTVVGYAVPQTVTAVAGQTASASFAVTPLVNALAFTNPNTSGTVAATFPQDGIPGHTATVNANVLAPNGQLITSPIDTTNLFGTVSFTVKDFIGEATPNLTATPAAQNAGSYNPSVVLSYDGSYYPGSYGVLTEHYAKNTTDTSGIGALFNAGNGPSDVTLNVLIASLNYKGSSDNGYNAATGGFYSTTYTNGVGPMLQFNGSGSGTYVLPVSVYNDNSPDTQSPSAATVGGVSLPACPAGVVGGITAPALNTQTYANKVYQVLLTINNVPSVGPCSITLVNTNFPTLQQVLEVVPSGSVAVGVSSANRRK